MFQHAFRSDSIVNSKCDVVLVGGMIIHDLCSSLVECDDVTSYLMESLKLVASYIHVCR